MALSLTKVTKTTFGNKRIAVYDVTFDSSYATGGESLAASDLGLKVVEQLVTDGGAKNSSGTSLVPVRYDYTNAKLQAYRYDGASAGKAFLEEVASAVDLSTFTVRVTAIGY
jgi:hypothetical protein